MCVLIRFTKVERLPSGRSRISRPDVEAFKLGAPVRLRNVDISVRDDATSKRSQSFVIGMNTITRDPEGRVEEI